MRTFVLLAFTAISFRLSAQPTIALQQYVTGLTNPLDIVHCGDDRLFIVQRNGVIRIIDGSGTLKPQPFMDINDSVNSNGGEQGLLGMAFHPDYKNNGYFFVNYIYDDPAPGSSDRNTRISRFRVSETNPDSAVVASEEIVLTIIQPYTNHNGGDLAFGADGYLYIPTGDGGDGGDPQNHAQNKKDFLGKILRLDVDSLPYQIPPDNPFANDANYFPEIWALGLRNPWRFSFDRLTNDLWLGDVGQGKREEVNFQPAASSGGENYGWRCYEGDTAYNTSGCSAINNYTFPVFSYLHNSQTGGLGCSAVGGVVYRGCVYPNLYGYYVFCDYCSGRFWTIHDSSGTWVTTPKLDLNNFRYSAIGEDYLGELYVAGISNGIIYKLIETAGDSLVCEFTISGTVATETDTPVAGVTVILSGDASDTMVTGNDGAYSFLVEAGGDYTVTPSKSNDSTAGINTLDIILIQRHILAIDTFESPYKIIAGALASASTDTSLTTLDIIRVRQMILDIIQFYPNNRLWDFVKSDFVFLNPLKPFGFTRSRSFDNLASNQTNQDFIGIKLGDVNNSWDTE